MTARAARAFVWLAAFAALLFALPARAYTPPPIAGHVTDTAGVLSASEVADLNARMDAVKSSSGMEIAILILPSLNGETIEDVGYATGNAWKVGRRGLDNGALLVVSIADRRMRIEVGKGNEGQLTDLQASDIIEKQIAPPFKQGHYYEGIRAGTDAIAASLTGQAPPSPRVARNEGGEEVGTVGTLVWILILLGFIIFFTWLRSRGGGGGGGFWISGGGGGSWGGGGWGGGGGGGGYSGGGGSFGGGGASGSW